MQTVAEDRALTLVSPQMAPVRTPDGNVGMAVLSRCLILQAPENDVLPAPMRFRKQIPAALLALFGLLTACSDGGSDNSNVGVADAVSGDALAPSTVADVQSPAGFWRGTSTDGRSVEGVVFDDGEFWLSYTAEQSSLAAGLVVGQAVVDAQGTLSGEATDFNLDGAGSRAIVLDGMLVARQSLALDILANDESVLSFTGNHSPTDAEPADVSSVLGAFVGTFSTVAGAVTSELVIGNDGMLVGVSAFGCDFTGSVSPRSDADVFELAFTFRGELCEFAAVQVEGIAWVSDSATLTVLAMTAHGSPIALVFNGSLDPANATLVPESLSR